ncbi:DUF58 domain-containing protein [Micropruina sp.]|uniref:DUF58 domain-containing protein n=1 Tax=Micropruina sp. TaxID=2737536 RepID=UPI0039E32851
MTDTRARPAPSERPPNRPDALGARLRARWSSLSRPVAVRWSSLSRPVRQLWTAVAPVRAALRPVVATVARVFAAVTGFGWTVLALAGLCWLPAVLFGWGELGLAAAVLLAAFAIGCAFTIGRMNLRVELDADPMRVTVGESSAARVRVTNLARTPALPIGLEFPVGAAVGRFTLPPLGADASHDEVVIIPTQHRGVIDLGPVVTQRGDPFGLVRREVTWTERLELFVHPRRVPLEPLGSGLLRDLEGHTTQDTSMSDLAFHTLREYAPGDDRRYIHWRSSAKVASAQGNGTFLVKQFLDTRRSHIAVVTDADEAAYADPSEFELAISVGASVAVRALADEMDLTIVCGDHAAQKPIPSLALDTYSRAGYGPWTLAQSTGRLNQLAPDASVAILVSGSRSGFAAFARARAHLAPEVHTFAITVVRGGTMALRQASGMTVLTVSTLNDLPRVLLGVSVQ